MITKFAICLLGFALLTACQTTQTTQTTDRKTLEERARTHNAPLLTASTEAVPPAIGPDWGEDIPAAGPDDEDVPAEGPRDIDRNPALVPSPLLRVWASSATP